jgi:hypothetical protein
MRTKTYTTTCQKPHFRDTDFETFFKQLINEVALPAEQEGFRYKQLLSDSQLF